jgi:hypothetical protein
MSKLLKNGNVCHAHVKLSEMGVFWPNKGILLYNKKTKDRVWSSMDHLQNCSDEGINAELLSFYQIGIEWLQEETLFSASSKILVE